MIRNGVEETALSVTGLRHRSDHHFTVSQQEDSRLSVISSIGIDINRPI